MRPVLHQRIILTKIVLPLKRPASRGFHKNIAPSGCLCVVKPHGNKQIFCIGNGNARSTNFRSFASPFISSPFSENTSIIFFPVLHLLVPTKTPLPAPDDSLYFAPYIFISCSYFSKKKFRLVQSVPQHIQYTPVHEMLGMIPPAAAVIQRRLPNIFEALNCR